ncbi:MULTISPECIES: hypothetical protein [Dyella]|uniref:Uncharacterized protein n=2 Tax=Dyella TaxID=231454 RepID=A0A4R0YPP0_9GAMM|nr:MULTISPECIES: hypothetical protein [Dyella]TBR35932.1 hypothetical protein EYV96_18250 [Dyella terrae]TCI08521.1 hypothetical protein EZM97_28305 [Dyella soli]
MSYRDVSSTALDAAEALTRFVVHAQLMLDPLTPEDMRREIEPQLLSVLPTLKALGVFELFAVRDPALRNLIDDELTQRSLRLAEELA